MHLGARYSPCFKANSDFDTLEGIDGHNSLSDSTIQLAIILHMAAKSYRDSFNDAFYDPADRISIRFNLIDISFHLLFCLFIDYTY
ncbi:hypothetical protein D3C73_1246660 [compost metagenome]